MAKNRTSLDILYQSDNNYAVVTAVSIVSLLENNKDIDEISINLIDGGITPGNLKNIEKIVTEYNRTFTVIDGKEIEKKLIELKCRPYKGSYVTYYKLLAFKNLRTKSDRILMLDGDILILQSLREICDIDLTGHIMAEIVDPYMPHYQASQIGIPKSRDYYNAGVMLINQAEWRKQKCEQQIMEHWAHKKSDYLFADQDITNVLFGAHIKELDIKYNFFSKNYMLHPYERLVMNLNKRMLENVNKNGAVCVHCIDESWRSRPWFKGNTHTMSKEWDRYLAMTPWKNWDKLETRLNTFHKIDKTLYAVFPKFLYALTLKLVSGTFARLGVTRRMLDGKKMHVTD